MSDLAKHIAHRRAQLTELEAMHADGHTGAQAGIAKVSAELEQLERALPPATPPTRDAADAQTDNHGHHDTEPETLTPADVVDQVVEPAAAAPASAPAKPKAKRSGKAKRKR